MDTSLVVLRKAEMGNLGVAEERETKEGNRGFLTAAQNQHYTPTVPNTELTSRMCHPRVRFVEKEKRRWHIKQQSAR